MAFAEKRGDWYRIVFRLAGKRYTRSLKTQREDIAQGVAGGVNRTLMLIEQRALHVPDDADVVSFVLSGGQQVKKAGDERKEVVPAEPVTLERLKKKYVDTLSIGAVEENSLNTVDLHLRHFVKTLGATCPLQDLTLMQLQEHIKTRAVADGIRGRKLSSTTIRKEIASLRAAWNWGVQAGLLTGSFPNKGLKYPKTTEKPPFQTWQDKRSCARCARRSFCVSEGLNY